MQSPGTTRINSNKKNSSESHEITIISAAGKPLKKLEAKIAQ
jgi:hypothetical protein